MAIAITGFPDTVRTDPISPLTAITGFRHATVKAIMAPSSGAPAMADMDITGMARLGMGTASGAGTDTTTEVTDTAANTTGTVDTDIPAMDMAGREMSRSDASADMERADRVGQLAPCMLSHRSRDGLARGWAKDRQAVGRKSGLPGHTGCDADFIASRDLRVPRAP